MLSGVAHFLPDLEQRLAAVPASSQLRFLPIRHHSPAVSQHLKRLFARDKPQQVLIEVPENLQSVLPYLIDRETRPPVALYCYRQETKSGAFGSRAYFPLARFSPEWVVLKLAASAGIPVRFIDAPYAQRSAFRPEDSKAEDRTLQNEHDWHNQHLVPRVLSVTGCRDIDELWDRWFESRAGDKDAEGFFRDLLAWCLLLRPDPAKADAETLLRERCMAGHIRDAIDSGLRTWVVTGGYHSEALALGYLGAASRQECILPTETVDKLQGVALIPYTLQRLDRANHYGAGLPDCGYYNALWNRSEVEAERVIADLTLQVADKLRSGGELASIPDCIDVLAQQHRLAALRGIRPGRMEWRDALGSCLGFPLVEKDNLLEQAITQTLLQERTGRISSAWPSLPIVDDFRGSARQFGLPLSAAAPLSRPLDIYRSQRHRDISAWLHRLDFLGASYAARQAGPDFAQGRDLQRVREIWMVQWQPAVEAKLTEQQYLGASILEAAANHFSRQLVDPSFARSIPALLPKALQMRLHELVDPCLAALDGWIRRTTRFEALVRALERMVYTDEVRRTLRVDSFPGLAPLQDLAYRAACRALAWIDDVDPGRLDDLLAAIRQLGGLAQMQSAELDADIFLDALFHLIHSSSPRLAGLACGLLQHHGRLHPDAARKELRRACRQAQLEPNYIGEYLAGLLSISRSLLFNTSEFLHDLNGLISRWDEDTFLQCLPSLRLAFTALKPRELNMLGERLEVFLSGEFRDGAPTLDELAPDAVQQAETLLSRWGW